MKTIQKTYKDTYTYTYNMEKTLAFNPTLESILMVEQTIQRNSQEFGKYQLWKKLPRKIMYQKFQIILDYLEKSGKIMIAQDGIVFWTYNPKRISQLRQKGLLLDA